MKSPSIEIFKKYVLQDDAAIRSVNVGDGIQRIYFCQQRCIKCSVQGECATLLGEATVPFLTAKDLEELKTTNPELFI